jgi:phosphoglucosamine mutase
VLLNVPVKSKPALSTLARTMAAQRKVELELGEDGRVLLRYSGTESLARVMVEGPDEALIRARAQELADTMAAEIGT